MPSGYECRRSRPKYNGREGDRPGHFQCTAGPGACGKTRAVPQNRSLEAEHGCGGGFAVIKQYVLGLRAVDTTQVAIVGGKGAQLGELSRIDGVRVPAGFCVTTAAYRRLVAREPAIDDRLDRLSRLDPDDREAMRTLGAEIRRSIEGIALPDDLAA